MKKLKEKKPLLLRLGEIKDQYLFVLVMAGQMTLDEAEKIIADRKVAEKKRELILGENLF